MALKDMTFSDLILMPDGRAFLKGTPDLGQQLLAVTPDLVSSDELDELAASVEKRCERGSTLANVRVRFGNMAFRVANYDGVDGNVYFLRRLAERVPELEELTPSYGKLRKFLLSPRQQKGLVLVCGAQASGKTTFAASFIASRLSLFGGHAVTYEIPVEMPLSGAHGEHGFCFQTDIASESELGSHIERSHRCGQPNIILAGEIRTKFAASEVLRVSLGSSCQLVVATLHGLNIVAALTRLKALASELDGEAACQNLSQSLLAILYLELTTESGQRTLKIPEVLLVPFNENGRSIRSKLREGKLSSLSNDITEQENLLKYTDMEDFA